MKKNGWKTSETLSLMKKCRSVVYPNRGFLQQLKKFESLNLANKDVKPKNESNLSSNMEQKNNNTEQKPKNEGKKFLEAFVAYRRNGSLANRNVKARMVYPTKCGVQARSKTVSKQIVK
jgi:hypothetical protein